MANSSVQVRGETVGAIDTGFLVLLGVTHSDTDEIARRVAQKVSGLRIFDNADGRMNLGLAEVGGAVLCISQFTLYGDVRRGRRPSFEAAAPGEAARPVYEAFCAAIESQGLRCERGVFGAEMRVALVNDGPVTVIIDSELLDSPRRA